MKHTVLVTVMMDVESKNKIDMSTADTFLNEMDYGFTSSLFNNNLKIINTEWVDSEWTKFNGVPYKEKNCD